MAPSATTDDACPSDIFYKSRLHKKRELRLEEYQIPPPSPGELQIEIHVTGICGSDVSYYQKRANGDIRCADGLPMCLGHESSGVVVAVGPLVKGFKASDRVALEVGVPCGQCTICRKGRYNLCKKMRFRSSAKTPRCDPGLFEGTLQQRINHPAMWCHKIPDNVSFEAAALLEPLSVAMHATNRAALATGSTALVIGAGTVGLLTAAMALQAGCTTVTIMDVDAGRVRFALEHGFATHGYQVPHPSPWASPSASPSPSVSGASTPDTLVSTDSGIAFGDPGRSVPCSIDTRFPERGVSDRLREAQALALDVLAATAARPVTAQPALAAQSATTARKPLPPTFTVGPATSITPTDPDDLGVDCTFECTGKESCMQTALYATQPGGRVIMVGMGTPVQTLPLSVAHLREVDVLGIFRYCNTYAAGLRLLAAGGRLPDLGRMVTHRFDGLARAGEAFELAGRTTDERGGLVLKVVIRCAVVEGQRV